MPAIITTNMRVHTASQFLSSFGDSSQRLYIFIGRTLAWDNDNSPPTPVDCPFDQSAAYRDMMSLKRLNDSDVSLVVSRNDWTSGVIYTQYSDSIDLNDPNSSNPPYYVMTESLNVYKCLSNNSGAASTVQPTGTSTSVATLSDGYQWKYMYTVNSADVLRFVTSEWIPVKTLDANDGSNQWLVQQAAVKGTIDRIDMDFSGTQYTEIPTVTITGDGTGATAVATISGGNVTKITVTSTGSNYTWATVAITGGGVGANGAEATAVLSPVAGHGADPVEELGGFYALVNAKLIYDEDETFSVANDYRRIGIVKNPLLSSGAAATDLHYTQATRLTFGSVSGTTFVADEVVTGSVSGAVGVVVDYDTTDKLLRLVEVVGSFVPGETVVGDAASGVLEAVTGTAASGGANTIVLANTASATNDAYTNFQIKILSGTGAGQIRTISSYVGASRTVTVSSNWSTQPDGTSVYSVASILPADLRPNSGKVLYMENRRPIPRASDQVEDIKIVVEF